MEGLPSFLERIRTMKMQNENLKRLTFFQCVLLILLCLTFISASSFAKHKKKFKGIIIVNQVLKLDGTLKINGNLAPEFSGVKEGDVLETGEKSVAIVRIVGLGIFRMSPKARFKLKSIHNRDESRFELIDGEVLSVFKRPGSHEVRLPHSLMSLHQGIFAGRVGNGDGDEVQLLDGKIEVKDLILHTSDSLNPKIPPTNSISKAEIKEPPKTIVDVAPHPESQTSEQADLANGHAKLIRLTPSGVSVIDQDIAGSEIKRNLSDLDSLYALP
jgi:hypothetical protein